MRNPVILFTIFLSLFLSACGGGGGGGTATSYDAADLNDTQKYSLAYMWHEEKLAHDLYLALNAVNPATQLYSIATNGETTHVSMVETLVKNYDINISNFDNNYTVAYSEAELRAMVPGSFAIPAVQQLYDDLYARGIPTLAASLEVGCIVEVVDVDDLNRYIAVAGENSYLVDTFEYLRAGSYNHYWAFDAALKDLGVVDGCCSLGDTYCKTAEAYPASH